MNTLEQYSIRQLSEISGVNAVTLRAWERRYGLLKPSRTAKGHRYYTADDVECVRQIVNWLDRGVAISKVRPLLDGDNSSATENINDHWTEAVNTSQALISTFQREKLAQQWDTLFGSYPLDTLAQNYFSPLQAALDRQSQLRFGGGAEKIFFESELYSDLQTRIRHLNRNNNGAPLLLVTFDAQQHGIHALLLALALLEAGFRLHMLFEACSLREIPYIVAQSHTQPAHGIRGVICHSDSKVDVLQLEQELARAAAHAQVPFFLSGRWLNITPALTTIAGTTTLTPSLRQSVNILNDTLRSDRHDQ